MTPSTTTPRHAPTRSSILAPLALLALAAGACAGEAPTPDPLGQDAYLPPPADAGRPDQLAPDAAEPPPAKPVVYLVLKDAPLRREPEAGAAEVRTVRRGARVTRLMDQRKTNSRLKVAYRDKRGWIHTNRVGKIEPGQNRRELAITYPNAFFKRQVRHPVWNPTGPLSSSNCAPTSLAIGAMVFGKEPADLKVEQSIDRVRKLMGKPSDSGSSSLAQVRTGATKLGLKWTAIGRDDLDGQLDKGHMVVHTGTPGDTSQPSRVTRYQRAFRDAGYSYTYDGPHSILVMARLASGKYLVADPLSTVGTVELGPKAMRDFSARWGGLGTAVWRPR